MALSPRRRRLLGRRPAVVHHAPDPARNVAAHLEAVCPVCQTTRPARDVCLVCDPPPVVSRETTPDHPMAPFVAGGQVPGRPAFEADAVAALQETPPPLSRERILRLEAATAQWVRDVRLGGPGPDDTLLYAAPKPPPPPALPAPIRARLEEEEAIRELQPDPLTRAALEAARRPARVSDWVSRHDPRSLEYAVAARLQRPVPVQDLVLQIGPILDQGTTPPLSLHDASACVGMAWAAAVNVLHHAGLAQDGRPRVFLDEVDARELYELAQDRDHVAGRDYAGTSVNAGAKAARDLGHIGGWYWGLRGTRDVAQALLQLRAPVVLGVPWTAGLEEPDAAGIIVPAGAKAGGHALVAVGILAGLRARTARPGPYFVLQQSRGPAEGRGGLVYLHATHLAQLLAGVGESAVPLPPGPAA